MDVISVIFGRTGVILECKNAQNIHQCKHCNCKYGNYIMHAVFSPEFWAESSENFNKISDVTWTISSGKAEFAKVVEFVNIVRIFNNFAVPCRLNNSKYV